MKAAKTLIIAEAGVNHNGDLQLAKQLIDAAADAGADMVKFQTFSAASMATASAPKAAYQRKSTSFRDSQKSMLEKLELDRDDHLRLIRHCQQRSIGFFSAAFDIPSLRMLNELGIGLFKVPSGEITNLPYLRHVGSFGKPVLLSTGMATMDEVAEALAVLRSAGVAEENITVLHCNTEYPTPMSDVNLLAMLAIRDRFGVSIGYSDHSSGTEVAVAAVALGARVIEKHLTLDRGMPGPDHGASLEPTQFAGMVRAIRNVSQAMGDGIKRPSASEDKNRAIVRKSLVAAKPIKAGEIFTPENITAKRPGSGISPMRWDEVMNKVAPRDFSNDELIEL
jgi:N,N'-diacetyllegionaminate synthase